MNILPDFDNCSTAIIGKNASATGRLLMAHNEDNGKSVSQTHVVPRAKHEAGETITFGDADGVIPQVPETYAYLWSEFRSLGEFGGESFSDSFFNEWGVAIASNSCQSSKISENEPVKMGLGYGLRRLIAERAKTAREGVEIAAQLVSQFGYRSSRCYQICDKDEAWVFQVVTGTNYVARRVGDDEVYFIPNWYTIHEIDFSDTDHKKFYWSEDLVPCAIRNGWYKPAKENDYSDFDFALTYQGDLTPPKTNTDRSDVGWKGLAGKKMPYRTFTIKAEKKYSAEDLKNLLRAHYMEWEEDLKDDPTMSPHRYGLCRDTTNEGFVVEFADDPNLTCVWRAFPRTCGAPFMPWYVGILKVPDGYEMMNWKASQVTHFAVDPSELQCDTSLAYWAFHRLQNMLEFDYKFCEKTIRDTIDQLEKEWDKTKPVMDAAYLSLKKENETYAKQLLTDYTGMQAKRAWQWAEETTMDLVDMRNQARMDFWRATGE